MAKDDDRCGECGGRNLEVVNIRPVRNRKRKRNTDIVARKIEVRCRRCKWTEFVLKTI